MSVPTPPSRSRSAPRGPLAFVAAAGLLGIPDCDNKDGAAKPASSAQAATSGAKNCCRGKNDCKGKGGCKTDKNDCMGKNGCKGTGGCNMNCSK